MSEVTSELEHTPEIQQISRLTKAGEFLSGLGLIVLGSGSTEIVARGLEITSQSAGRSWIGLTIGAVGVTAWSKGLSSDRYKD